MVYPEYAYAKRNYSGGLNGISRVSASACTAVGYTFSNINGTVFTLTEVWDGSSWTAQSTPRESETIYNELSSVACLAPPRCIAVGKSLATGRWEPLIEAFATSATPNFELSFGSQGSEDGQFNSSTGIAVDGSGV